MGRLVDIDDVIKAVDSHMCDQGLLDEDISVILEEVPTANPRPVELYAVEDCISGVIIFNARGGCYKDLSGAENKISRLVAEKGGMYKPVKYVLTTI